MCAQAGERGDDLAQRYIADASGRNGLHRLEPCRRRVDGFLVIDIDRCRTDEQVAVYGRGYEDALAHGGRQLENRAGYMFARCLVEENVFALARGDMHLMRADHVVEFIGIDAGGVDNRLRLDGLFLLRIPVVYGEAPSVFALFDAAHLRIQAELRAVHHGVFRKAHGQLERADDTAGRGKEAAGHIVRQIRLLFKERLPAENLRRHAVCASALCQLLKAGRILILRAHNDGAVSFKRHVQFLCNLIHHPVAFHIHLCLQRARLRVETGMHDGAVRLGGAAADIFLAFNDKNAGLISGKFPGNGTACHAGTDDYSIKHLYYPFLL